MKIVNNIDCIKKIFTDSQDYACQVIEAHHNQPVRDYWQRQKTQSLQGEGCSIVFEDGQIIEKGGINFSFVYGQNLPPSATNQRHDIANQPFHAIGVSLVFHPHNPYIPTSHGNIRLFISQNQQGKPVWWFGGGYDLTPYYVNPHQAKQWHQQAAKLCQCYGDHLYSQFKKNCDDYFWLKHRGETRGIGGLFFDDLNEDCGWSFEQGLEFVAAVGKTYIDSYNQLIKSNKNHSYGERERNFQLYRRGRYVEFNLIYDRGTLFGLQSGGRTESILMSLPNRVHWKYNYQPEPGSAEAELGNYLKPIDWLNWRIS